MRASAPKTDELNASRPESNYAETKNKPFSRPGFKVDFGKAEPKTEKPQPEAPIISNIEGTQKFKVNIAADFKPKPKKKEENFFDDLPEKVVTKARPDLLKHRTDISAHDDRKPKEKNYFDDDGDDFGANSKDGAVRPNLGKVRQAPLMATSQAKTPMNFAKKQEPAEENPYGDFQVVWNKKDEFQDPNEEVAIKFDEAPQNEIVKQRESVDDSIIFKQKAKAEYIRSLVKMEVERSDVFEISSASTLCLMSNI